VGFDQEHLFFCLTSPAGVRFCAFPLKGTVVPSVSILEKLHESWQRSAGSGTHGEADVYSTCVGVVLEVFAVLIGVGVHDFFTQRQDEWAGVHRNHPNLIFWSAFIALLCCALSYFIGGALYLYDIYVASGKREKPHVCLFLIAISSRVVFGVLLL
jgi:hypothetical protein